MGDIFNFQDKVTDSVVGLIEPKIRFAEIERARRKRPGSLDATTFISRPCLTSMEWTREALRPRCGCFDRRWRSIRASTWRKPTLRGRSKNVSTGRPRSPHRMIPQSAWPTPVQRSPDPDEPLVLAIAGFITISIAYEFDIGLTVARKAIRANPYNVVALELCGYTELLVGDVDRAIEYFHRFIRLSPNAPNIFTAISGVAFIEMERGNFESAVEWCRKSLATFKEWPMTYWALVPSLAHLGRMQEAKKALAKLLVIAPNTSMATLPISVPRFAENIRLQLEGFIKAGLT